MVCNTVKTKNADAKRWNQAIEDAKDTIAKCQRKIESMRGAIAACEQARDEGASYPRNRQLSYQTAEQQHVV